MRINRLKLRDFRNHAETEMDLGDLNLIVGPNASGKTSLAMAIEYALTGRCDVTDKAGKGSADLIRVGCDEATVKAAIETPQGPYIIERSIPSKLLIVDEDGVQVPGGIRELQAILYGMMGADEELITASLNCSRITGWSAADIKSVAFPLLGVGQDAVQDALVDWLTVHAEGSMRLLDLAAKYAAFTDLDQRYDAIFKARKDAKKLRDKAQADLDAEGEMVTPDRDKLATMEAQLAQRKAELAELERKTGAAEQNQKEMDRICQQIEAVQAELTALVISPVPDEPELEHDIQAVTVEAADKEGRLHEWQMEQAKVSGELKGLEAAITSLKEAADACPLAPGLINCSMDAADRKKIAADLKKQHKEKEKNFLEDVEAITAFRLEVEETHLRLNELKDRERGLLEMREETTRRASIRATLEARAEELEKAKRRCLEATKHPDDLEAEKQALNARIGTGESLIAVARVDVQKADRQKVLRAAVEEARQLVDDYEILVKAFGPDGFRAYLLEGGIGPLEQRVNDNLQMLTRGEYSVQIDGADFKVYVAHGGCTVELKHLSASEQVRIGLALTEALIYHAGLGLVILDACEILDGPNKNRLIAWAMQRKADHQIILLATSEDPKPIEGMQVFKCESGRVEEVVMEGVGV